jgi:subtilase family serine protease
MATGQFTATVTSTANVSVTATATDELGNTSEFSPVFQLGGGQPDFTVVSLQASPATVNAGDNVSLQFAIRNQGTSTASSATHNVVLSADNKLDGTDIVLGNVTTNMLPPNASQNFVLDVKIPADGLNGALFIGVIADPSSTVTESQEANNTASAQLAVNLLADLSVGGLTVSKSTVNPGENLRVGFTVSNLGSANTNNHVQEVRLSADATIDATDTLLVSLPSNGINAGAAAQFVIDVQIPQTVTPGSYFVGVISDGGKTITESSEDNNTTNTAITVSGSIDLEVRELTIQPTSGAPGSQVALSFKVNNLGSLAAPASNVAIRLSANQTFDNNDLLLGTVNTQAIAAGGSATLTFTAQLPTTLPAGGSFIGVIVDPQGQVSEGNENNNVISGSFNITDQTAPSVTITSPNGNETITAGSNVTINWTATDDLGVTTQDIFLSVDGGASFNQVIAAGLPGNANTFNWNVPTGISTGTARIQIVARDSQGNVGRDSSDNNFAIGQRPTLTNPRYNNGKFIFAAAGSNIEAGATLVVINGQNRESFAITLSANGANYTVKKNDVSANGLKIRQAILKGVPVQLVIRNANGIESAPITFQR